LRRLRGRRGLIGFGGYRGRRFRLNRLRRFRFRGRFRGRFRKNRGRRFRKLRRHLLFRRRSLRGIGLRQVRNRLVNGIRKSRFRLRARLLSGQFLRQFTGYLRYFPERRGRNLIPRNLVRLRFVFPGNRAADLGFGLELCPCGKSLTAKNEETQEPRQGKDLFYHGIRSINVSISLLIRSM
jgi:hypothetical protein